MNLQHPIVKEWFRAWDTNDLDALPISDDFSHTSPFGTIEPKEAYMNIVNSNKDSFLDNEFNIIDEMQDGDNVCVRYELINKKGVMPVCEWFVIRDETICRVYSYYNIGDATLNK